MSPSSGRRQLSLPVLGIVYGIVLGAISAYLTRRLFENTGKIQMTTKELTASFLSLTVYGLNLGLLIPVFV